MTKLNLKAIPVEYMFKNELKDDEETFPIECMTGNESRNILDIMDHQQEMFLGGLNDKLMDTTLGIYTETKEQFEKIRREYKKLFRMVEEQENNDDD